MKLVDFRDLLLTAAPAAAHYFPPREVENYTIWAEYGADNLSADSMYIDQKWRIQVDRFTKIEYDPVVSAITELLKNREDIGFKYLVDSEPDTKYIHHIWDCQVI